MNKIGLKNNSLFNAKSTNIDFCKKHFEKFKIGDEKKFSIFKKNFPVFLISAMCISIMLLLAIKPEIYLNSAKDGFILFGNAVLPALFPFFFFSNILTALGLQFQISKMLKKPIEFLFNCSSVGAYTMLMSFLCGYPVGSKLISDLFQNEQITQEDAKKMSVFSSTSNPIFILGTVATAFLHNQQAGFIILMCHYLSAIISGLLFRGKKVASSSSIMLHVEKNGNILLDAVEKSMQSMLVVGGFLCIFNVVCDAVLNIGLIDLIYNLFNEKVDFSLLKTIMLGSIEMTRGCYLTQFLSLDPKFLISLCSFFISFGGFGIIIQNYVFLKKTGMKFWQVLFRKFVQAIIAFSITYLFALIFKI